MEKKGTGERLEPNVFNETTIEHLHRYAIALDLVQNKEVLDIACGEGYGANLLSVRAAHVTGLDKDDAVIKQASTRYKKDNLRFITGNAEELSLPAGEYDIVTSFETIEHVANQSKMIAELKKMLKPGGLLIISTPNKKMYSDETGRRNPYHVKELYEEAFTGMLRQHFRNIEILKQQTTLSSLVTTARQTNITMYSGDYNKIDAMTGSEALYFIALVSDAEIPLVNTSLFNGQFVYQNVLREREKFVANTITYKTGHILLYPFKLLRKLFKKG